MRKLIVKYLILLLTLPCCASSNPWLNDPLAKINLFSGSEEQNPEKKNTNECLLPPLCSVCDITEEWPLDFDGDDLAEKAQKRQCNLKENNLIAEEIIIIYASDGEPIIYKSNLMNCQKDKLINYQNFQRFDFNHDNLDELLIVEHDQKTDSEEIKVLGYNQGKALIEEMPLIEYESDLKDQFKGDLQNVKKQFLKINGQNSFIVSLKTDNHEEFKIYYYQDAANKAFYPLHLIKVITQKPPSQITKAQQPSTEFIE